MLNKSLVSSIIIFLNAEKFIREAIESVFAQTYENWELFLVDDGSTDGSSQIANHYAEQYQGRVRYLEHPGHHNLGMSASRNLGIINATGEYLAFLDADDVWFPNSLERQVALLESHPEAGMVYGSAQYWYSWTGTPEDLQRDFRDFVEERAGANPDSLLLPPALLTALLQDGSAAPCICSTLMRYDVVRAVGAFQEEFPGQYEDQALFAKLGLQTPVLVAGECWSRYRQHPESSWYITQKTGQHRAARRFFLGWLAEYLSDQEVKDQEIWKLIDRELTKYCSTAQLEVVDVSIFEVNPERLWGFYIDTPRAGQRAEDHELRVEGWALGRGSAAVAVELVSEGAVVRRVPINAPRPDVAAAYPGIPEAKDSGFSVPIDAPGTTELELGVRAVLRDHSRVPLGSIRAQRWGEDYASDPPVMSGTIPGLDHTQVRTIESNMRKELYMAPPGWMNRIGIRLKSIGEGTAQLDDSPSDWVDVELTASPNPVPAGSGLGITTVSWNTGDDSVGQIYLCVEGQPDELFTQGARGIKEAPWISSRKSYNFRLYAGTKREKQLASVTVSRGAD